MKAKETQHIIFRRVVKDEKAGAYRFVRLEPVPDNLSSEALIKAIHKKLDSRGVKNRSSNGWHLDWSKTKVVEPPKGSNIVDVQVIDIKRPESRKPLTEIKVKFNEGHPATSKLIWNVTNEDTGPIPWDLGADWAGYISEPSFCAKCQGGAHVVSQCSLLKFVDDFFKEGEAGGQEAEDGEEQGSQPKKRRRDSTA